MDPSIWVGLLTLVVLEIVLGIDNLVFIAILADKLPPKQRDKARLIGLSLALFMRLGLLSVISWMVTLTKPLFSIADFSFSGRDLIMLLGGSLSARIAIKTRLSIPRTISRTTSVNKPAQIEGSIKNSMSCSSSRQTESSRCHARQRQSLLVKKRSR
jgi:predicted tellurium resistance membrane protein TerC